MTPISYHYTPSPPFLYTPPYSFSHFYAFLCALVTINTAYTIYFFLIHHCTNSRSSLHIFVHHCTFCASLHTKTSPGRSDTRASSNSLETHLVRKWRDTNRRSAHGAMDGRTYTQRIKRDRMRQLLTGRPGRTRTWVDSTDWERALALSTKTKTTTPLKNQLYCNNKAQGRQSTLSQWCISPLFQISPSFQNFSDSGKLFPTFPQKIMFQPRKFQIQTLHFPLFGEISLFPPYFFKMSPWFRKIYVFFAHFPCFSDTERTVLRWWKGITWSYHRLHHYSKLLQLLA